LKSFYKEALTNANNILSSIIGGEYFIDQDPGHGSGLPITVVQATNITNLGFAVDVTNLPLGFHQLSVRFRNGNGEWSHANTRAFYKEVISADAASLPDLVKLEYFIDTDPGFGNGIPIPLNPATNISSFAFPVDMSTVSIGNHKVYVRALEGNGKWSHVHSGSFIVEPPAAIYITIGTISQSTCAGNAFAIPFAVNMPYGSNNTFTAQLSDVNGNFANPVTIGTLTGSNSDTIHATIPASAAVGNSYRVRILASSPLDTSAASGTSFRIGRVPEISFSIIGEKETCKGIKTYTASSTTPNVQYTWSLNGGGTLDSIGTTANVTWTTAGSYVLSLTPSNGCGNGTPRTLNVTVYDTIPLTPPTISLSNRLLRADNSPFTVIGGYQWYRNDTLLTGATNNVYNAVLDGIYKVARTNACGIGVMSSTLTVSTLLSQTISFDSTS
ncbi:MAG: PKD domain-containing protein, partial [Sphingobacteriales bacterium]